MSDSRWERVAAPMRQSLTGDFQVKTVAVVHIAAVSVEQTLGAQAVEGLPGRNQVVPVDADAYVLLLPLDGVRGGHAGAVRLALIARLLAGRAVAMKSWKGVRQSRRYRGMRRNVAVCNPQPIFAHFAQM